MQTTEFKTEQENFWAGEFGDTYIGRNDDKTILASNIHLFATIFKQTDPINSVIEMGANIGLNLRAIKHLLPDVTVSAVEINQSAASHLRELKLGQVYNQSFLEFKTNESFDLVLSKGVLIHLNPEVLKQAYQTMYSCSKKYICIAEYYNPTPMAIDYRGHKDKLFKRDFAGDMLDLYPNLRLVDYGFVYHRDKFPQDDLSWFLLEKRG